MRGCSGRVDSATSSWQPARSRNCWSPGRVGNDAALDPLMTLVYDELHRIAKRHLARERPGVLQPTALVHEAYLRLIEQSCAWQNRAHFFAIAAQMMRRILVDEARAPAVCGAGRRRVAFCRSGMSTSRCSAQRT